MPTQRGLQLVSFAEHPLIESLSGEFKLKDLEYELITGNPSPQIILDKSDKEFLESRRILVTGAGGSIGSRICKILSTQTSCELFMLDRDENALHSLSLSIQDKALLDQPDYIVADIRDEHRIFSVLSMLRPDVVIHTAALKHVPTLERDPREALLTNVIGTLNVLEAAKRARVLGLVNISTDKAANPRSVLGKSKKYGEDLIALARQEGFKGFTSVRFGNVFNSKGSVLETFNKQIERDLPLTITDPLMKRFFMHIDEASLLVLKSLVINGGPLHVLRMGEQIAIIDLVENLLRFHGKSLETRIVGIRGGEKLTEDLTGVDEILTDSSNDKIQVIKSKIVNKLPSIPKNLNSEKEILEFFSAV